MEIEEMKILLAARDAARKEKLAHREIAKSWAKQERDLQDLIDKNNVEQTVKEHTEVVQAWTSKKQEELNDNLI